MNTVQVIKFDSWSDSCGYRHKATRTGILTHVNGKTKLIPIMSGRSDFFERTDSMFKLAAKKFGLDHDSWLAFGYEQDYDKSKRKALVRKNVPIDHDDLLAKRSNYHKHNEYAIESPY